MLTAFDKHVWDPTAFKAKKLLLLPLPEHERDMGSHIVVATPTLFEPAFGAGPCVGSVGRVQALVRIAGTFPYPSLSSLQKYSNVQIYVLV